MVFVDYDEGGISPTFCVEEDLGGPCFTVVGGTTKGHMRAGVFVVGVRKVESSFSVWIGNEGSHANWFGQRGVVCRVSEPTLAEIFGLGDCTTVSFRFVGAVSIIAHVEEERAIREFCDCAFRCIVPSMARDVPRFSVILGPNDIGKG